ncbi:MAG: F420-nonreducing hydrogenase [Methanomicrobiales archaeon]|nr:F420-nonreducing hydrogenase [Methanomicrobiales archaeon]
MKIAIEELAGCSGCTISLLDIHEELLNVLKDHEIVYSPVIMDVKEPPNDIDIAFVTGAVRNEENEKRLKEIRRKAKKVVALGTCACYGGISGLSMLSSNEEIFRCVYQGVETVKEGNLVPGKVPPFLYRAFAVGDLARVDYYITGCPPKEHYLNMILPLLLKGEKPGLPRKSVCAECDRVMGSVEGWKMKRRHEGTPDREHCLLGQGYLCLGSVTFGRCGATCPHNNIPCHGCNGPSLDILREPCRDIHNLIVRRIVDLTGLPAAQVEKEMFDIAHTLYTFTIGSLIMEDKETSKIRDLVKGGNI